MSLGGTAPPSFIVIFAGAICIIMGPMITMVLGISETIPILLGVVIMVIGAPISIYMGKDNFTSFPPCMVFGSTGFMIVFAGIWISFPYGNPLASALVIIGILQAVIGGSLGTLYARRRRKEHSSSMWSGSDEMERLVHSRRDTQQYEYRPRKERVIEREVLLKQRIPLECDNCGAPINPEELDWIGSDTIKCLNCGTSLRVETERV